MSTPTYVAIATVTVTNATQASMSFTNIPSTYTDLAILASARTDRDFVIDGILALVNSTSTNQSSKYIYGTGSGAASSSETIFPVGSASGAPATANSFGSSFAYIPNYAGSSNKTVIVDGLSETNAATSYQILSVGLWSQTAAITSLELKPGVGTHFMQYSTATLYGILKQ